MHGATERASSPTVEALVADEGLLSGTLQNVARALRNKAANPPPVAAGSLADILELSVEPRVSGQVHCCDSCHSMPGGPIGLAVIAG